VSGRRAPGAEEQRQAGRLTVRLNKIEATKIEATKQIVARWSKLDAH
jgi:hypothetical protein